MAQYQFQLANGLKTMIEGKTAQLRELTRQELTELIKELNQVGKEQLH